jgi:hypothetical protein
LSQYLTIPRFTKRKQRHLPLEDLGYAKISGDINGRNLFVILINQDSHFKVTYAMMMLREL